MGKLVNGSDISLVGTANPPQLLACQVPSFVEALRGDLAHSLL